MRINSTKETGQNKMTILAIVFISMSIVLQVAIGVLTLIEAAGLKTVGASASSDKAPKRRRAKSITLSLMIISFMVTVINYMIGFFTDEYPNVQNLPIHPPVEPTAHVNTL